MRLIVAGIASPYYTSTSVVQNTNRRRLWLAAGLIVAFILLSGALSQFSLAPGLRIQSNFAETLETAFARQDRAPNPLGGDAIGIVVSVTVGLGIIMFIVGVLRKESRVSTLVALLVGIGLAFLLSGLVRPQEDDDLLIFGDQLGNETDGAIGILDPLDPEDAVDEYPDREPTPWAWSVAIVGAGAVGLFFVLRPYLRRKQSPPNEEMAQVAADAADAIAAGQSLGDVVQRCYRDMVATLEASSSVRRSHWMTPREFEDRLVSVGADVSDVRGLTRLFELSRYSDLPPSEADEQLAIEHLRHIALAFGESG